MSSITATAPAAAAAPDAVVVNASKEAAANGASSEQKTTTTTTTTTSTQNFAMRLLHNILTNATTTTTTTTTTSETANVLISPFLVESLLALLYLGADGSTAQELQLLLQLKRFGGSNAKMANFYATHLELNTSDDAAASESRIELASRLLLPASHSAGEEFQQIAQKYFQTRLEQPSQPALALQQLLGAAAASSSSSTAETVADASSDICAALTAVLHFKWFLPFSAYRSGSYDFHTLPAAGGADAPSLPQPVAMLFDDDLFVKFGEFRELDARAIELPCEHDTLELTMLLVLPNQRDGLAQLLRQLCDVDVAALSEQRMQMESVQVLLPKFKIDYSCTLRDALEALGVSSMFSKLANFTHLAGSAAAEGSVKLANIWHRVRLQVNESGSAASTAVGNKPIVLSNSTRQKIFRADHPFYFAIRAGDVIYFAGQVVHC